MAYNAFCLHSDYDKNVLENTLGLFGQEKKEKLLLPSAEHVGNCKFGGRWGDMQKSMYAWDTLVASSLSPPPAPYLGEIWYCR